MSGLTFFDILNTLLMILIGVLVVLFTEWVISYANGWRRLVPKFKEDRGGISNKANKIRQKPLYGRMWWNHLIICNALSAGLRIRVPLSMRIFHPPLLIPWDRFKFVPVKESVLLLSLKQKERYRVVIDNVETSMSFDKKYAEQIADFARQYQNVDIMKF